MGPNQVWEGESKPLAMLSKILTQQSSSIAMGGTCPPPEPQSGRVMRIAEKSDKNGGGCGVQDQLGQTNYAEIRILVTIYISKLNKIQITCHALCVFQILVRELFCANKHAEQPGFFSCFTSGSCTLAKYTMHGLEDKYL